MVNHVTQDNRPDIAWWDDVLDPVVKSASRTARFVRYLMDRDIARYNPGLAPPVSDGKSQQQRMQITDPARRHLGDAVYALTRAGRSVVELQEVLDIMSACSHNEYENLDGNANEPQRFTAGIKGNVSAGVLRLLERDFVQRDPKKMRTDRKRWNVYLRLKSPETPILIEAHREDVLDALDRDRKDHPIVPDHLPKAARGSVRPPPIGGEFDD